ATLWADVKLDASAVNDAKTREEDLTVDDLLHVLSNSDPKARARAAQLIGERAERGTFTAADRLAEALRNEPHLEVIRRLRGALAKIVGHRESDSLDGLRLLAWWDANKEAMRRDHHQPQ